MRRSRFILLSAVVVLVAVAATTAVVGATRSSSSEALTEGFDRDAPGGERGKSPLDPAGAQTVSRPRFETVQGVSRAIDVRTLGGQRPVVRQELPERGDPASQTDLAPTAAATPSGVGTSAVSAPAASSLWTGLDYAYWGCGYPPDTNGDVGASHYIQSVNCSVGIWAKSNGSRVAAFTFDALFDGTGTLCDTNNYGDPVAVYDSFANRWIVTDLAFTTDASGNPTSRTFECVAVSKSADPVTGGWWFYALPVSNVGDVADYPKVGVWRDGIYFTFNLYGTSGFKNVRVLALNRVDAEAGTARTITFDLPQGIKGVAVFSLLPSNARASTGAPPTGRPNLLASIYGSYAVRVWKFTANWTTPSSSTLTGPTDVPTGTFSVGPSTSPTPANPNGTLTYRLMMQNQYSLIAGKESLWLTHTVGVSNIAAPAWYQVGVTGGTVSTTMVQKGAYAPGGTLHRYTPSLAVDKQGDMALGYSVSNASTHPQIRYAARLAADTAGTLGSEGTMFAGTGSQNYSNRWGDYSAMSLDPADGCTFWFTTEAYNTTGKNWQTKIGSFKLPSCT